jgi:hypothetical protein
VQAAVCVDAQQTPELDDVQSDATPNAALLHRQAIAEADRGPHGLSKVVRSGALLGGDRDAPFHST